LAAELRLYAIGHNPKLISNSFQFVEKIPPKNKSGCHNVTALHVYKQMADAAHHVPTSYQPKKDVQTSF